jgi:hypothetical protein
MNFYCQKLVGDAEFNIAEWNEQYKQVLEMGLSDAEQDKLLFGERECCKEQCFKCLAIVGERRKRTAELLNQQP